MRIDDDELRDLFQQESSEHLQTLEEGLLQLEANPQDTEVLPELFRAAHSLKGAARMVEANSAADITHRFEDVLGKARRGLLTLAPHTIDRFYQTLDAVRAFCEESITGHPAPYDIDEILQQLDQDTSAKDPQAPTTVDSLLNPVVTQPETISAPENAGDPAWAEGDATPDAGAARIDDDVLRGLFKAETSEHIECLERGLMHLEQHPRDAARVEEVFRAAHSLKGAARMLAVSKVEKLAHVFEEALGNAHKGDQQLTTAVIDRLYTAVDSLREFCDEAVTGHPVITDLDTVVARLSGGGNPTTLATTLATTPTPQDTATTSNAIHIATNSSAPAALTTTPQSTTLSIDTIRVASTKLDKLMSQAGELAVTRGRIAHRVVQVEQLLALWEQWNRESYLDRSLVNSPSGDLTLRDIDQLLNHARGNQDRIEQFGQLLKSLEAAVQGDDARVDLLATQLGDGIRAVRMLPLSTVFNFFPRMVRDLARAAGKQIELEVHGAQTTADKRILEELKDPLTHMLRNAIDHGIESPAERAASGKSAIATLKLSAYQRGTNVVIEVADDGSGIDIGAVRQAAMRRNIVGESELATMSETQIQHLIFAPGFSTQQLVTDLSGRGVGMDVVRANIERLRGSIEVQSRPGVGTTFRLLLPLTVATRRVLLVAVDKATFAIPVEYVQTNRLVSNDEIFSMQGRGTILLDGQPVPVAQLCKVLELPATHLPPAPSLRSERPAPLECIILRVEGKRFGFLVDELLKEQEVVVKTHGAILRRVRNVSGSTILENGEVCITLNPQDLIRSALASSTVGTLGPAHDQPERKKAILLVEDSIVTRTQEKRILETAGFEVVTAVDGEDAYNKLMSMTTEFDGIVSDVEMPNLSGIDLTAKIRSQAQYRNLPVILVTSLSTDEDRRRGMEVGADAYLTKPGFDQAQFIETVKRFI